MNQGRKNSGSGVETGVDANPDRAQSLRQTVRVRARTTFGS